MCQLLFVSFVTNLNLKIMTIKKQDKVFFHFFYVLMVCPTKTTKNERPSLLAFLDNVYDSKNEENALLTTWGLLLEIRLQKIVL